MSATSRREVSAPEMEGGGETTAAVAGGEGERGWYAPV
jgi:hypothetical protein